MADQSQDLVSLVYVSSAIRPMDNASITDILQVSRRNNERLGITGMLLYRDGNFMQTLEGPDAAVLGLEERIGRDPRHRGVIRLLHKKVKQRSFDTWSMAFSNLDVLSPEDERAFSPFLSGSLLDEQFRTQPQACYKLMLHFKNKIR